MSVNAGARLDRLPLSRFHRRIMRLIGIGMFFDGFDIYIASTVLGTTLQSGFSTALGAVLGARSRLSESSAPWSRLR